MPAYDGNTTAGYGNTSFVTIPPEEVCNCTDVFTDNISEGDDIAYYQVRSILILVFFLSRDNLYVDILVDGVLHHFDHHFVYRGNKSANVHA